MASNPRRTRYAKAIPRCIVAILLTVSALGIVGTSRAAHAAGQTVLLLGDTLAGGTASPEYQAAVALGFTPTIVDGATWDSMTAAQFAAYDALVIGDPACQDSESYLSAAISNAATWESVLSGNISIVGTDPTYHTLAGVAGAKTLISDVINFAASTPGKTGAYIALGCSDALAPVNNPIPLLNGLGSFTDQGQGTTGVGCPNRSHIVATSPALNGLADTDLSNWNCSTHEVFDSFPTTGTGAFSVLAIQEDDLTGYVATDGTAGGPYILARGPSLTIISNIQLSPTSQNVNACGTATLTANVTQGSPPVPVVGTTVTFTVTGGPDTGKTATGVTDASGNASFTYTVSCAAGLTDTVIAQFVDSSSHTQTSNNALVNIVAAADTTPPSCALTGVIAGPPKQIQITVQDSDGGLQSVVVTEANNATVAVPTFTSGTTSPLVVTATKVDQTQGAQVALQVTDVAGNVTNCDPILSDIIRDDHQPSIVTANNVAQSEHLIHIYNGVPGLTHLTIRVNGVRMVESDLEPGEVRIVDISAALQPGTNNTVTVVARGKQRGDATFVIANS